MHLQGRLWLPTVVALQSQNQSDATGPEWWRQGQEACDVHNQAKYVQGEYGLLGPTYEWQKCFVRLAEVPGAAHPGREWLHSQWYPLYQSGDRESRHCSLLDEWNRYYQINKKVTWNLTTTSAQYKRLKSEIFEMHHIYLEYSKNMNEGRVIII